MKFFIITTGYNCEKFVKACYESIITQTCTNWYALMVSDGSTDRTGKNLNGISHKQIKTVHYPKNVGAAFRRWQAIKQESLNNEDVIILLGMDDMLKFNCLERIEREYNQGAWLTYGNWISVDGIKNKFQRPELGVLKKRNYRRSKWIYTNPNTFKKFLVNQIVPQDLQDKQGNWLTNCTDLAFMYPCLEQCPPEKIHGIEDIIYIYRNKHPNTSLKRYGAAHKTEAREWLKTMKIKPLYEKRN